MKSHSRPYVLSLILLTFSCGVADQRSDHSGQDFRIVKYNHAGAVSDLGVGLWAWPVPMDFDGDGDMDLLVSCADRPFDGLYFFENTSGKVNPIFAAPVRLGNSINNIQISYAGDQTRILVPGAELLNFRDSLDRNRVEIFSADSIVKDLAKKPTFNQWKMVDYDNDSDLDVIVGVDDWSDYGWDNAYDHKGNWTNGRVHGYLYLIERMEDGYINRGRIQAAGKAIDVFGSPSPNVADFDLDGDIDIICGEFLDRLTWFENIGTPNHPEYAEGKYLSNLHGVIRMDLQMIVPVAVDWDHDNNVDLVVGDEDGRVAWMRNTGRRNNHMPEFESPVYFQQEADNLKFGALVTPVSVDWDDDGDSDIVAGNSAGYLGFIENIGDGNPPRWAPPVLLRANGEVIRIQAGTNGSIQGPAEAKWGYTTLSIADWDGNGLKDIIHNSIWGKIEWFRNTGQKGKPLLDKAEPIRVLWEGQTTPKPKWNWWSPKDNELVTQWRTVPYAIDWNKDGLMDLVMLDHEGYLALFLRVENDGQLNLLPGTRIFSCVNGSVFDSGNKLIDETPGLLRLNAGEAGRSGRRKFTFMDWDSDGDLDLLANSENISVFENVGETNGQIMFRHNGPVSKKILAGHTTSPTTVDWNKNGVLDLLVGAEDGHLYHLER